ncbi:MAG: class I SAM-dependent methyltransferase [Parachlamydiaceae bacterium]
MKKIYLIILTLLSVCHLSAEMPEPYRSINVLPFDGQGFFTNQEPLKNLIEQRAVKSVIEVGSWLGYSTRFIASEIAEDGVVYAIDHWRGSPDELKHRNDPRQPYVYQQFLSNVVHAGLTQKIKPIRMNSLEAADALKLKVDLVYLDAFHDTDTVYKNIMAWYPHLNEGGILCGDDWLWPTVQVAVGHAAAQLGRQLHTNQNFWWFE